MFCGKVNYVYVVMIGIAAETTTSTQSPRPTTGLTQSTPSSSLPTTTVGSPTVPATGAPTTAATTSATVPGATTPGVTTTVATTTTGIPIIGGTTGEACIELV